MKNKYFLIVVVPCFNEAKRLELIKWIEYIQSHPDYFFIFVNDGSHDETAIELEKLSPNNNLKILDHQNNQGKADAVFSGISFATMHYDYEFIAFIDADLSVPLCEIDRFSNILISNPDLVLALGSRVQMLGKKIKRNLMRHYVSRVIATFVCKILDEPVYDTQCGLKVFRKNIIKNVFNEPFISRWLFDLEILARYKVVNGSKEFNEKLIEVPVIEWIEKENSNVSYLHFFSILSDLIKIKRKYF